MQVKLTDLRLRVFASQMQSYAMDWDKYRDANDDSTQAPALSSVSVYKEFELPESKCHPSQTYPWFLLRPIDPLQYKQAQLKLVDDEAEEGEEEDELDVGGGGADRPSEALPSENPK